MSKKIQVNFDDNALKVLDDLKDSSQGGSYADVIRNAIGLYEWARQECAQGNAIGVIKDGVAIKEVVLPFTVFSNPKPSPNTNHKEADTRRFAFGQS